MSNAIVLVESLTGNTWKAGEMIAANLQQEGWGVTSVCSVRQPELSALAAADLVLVGSWTDGLFVVGQRPGGAGHLWALPVFAGKRAANVYGTSAGRLAAVNHRDHDALLGAVFAHYRLNRPHEAVDWIGEDARPKAGFRIKDPDAFLVDAAGTPYRAIESAGGYAPAQVEAFHQHCVENQLAYELW